MNSMNTSITLTAFQPLPHGQYTSCRVPRALQEFLEAIVNATLSRLPFTKCQNPCSCVTGETPALRCAVGVHMTQELVETAWCRFSCTTTGATLSIAGHVNEEREEENEVNSLKDERKQNISA